MSTWHLPSGSLARQGFSVLLTPERAGWDHCGLRVVELGARDHESFATGDDELVAVPLAGAFEVVVDDERLRLDGRSDVFDGPTDVAYLPPGARVVVGSRDGGRLALASARARPGVAARRDPVDAATTEQRGSGRCGREVRGYCMPGHHEADRLMVCEVVTPRGGWSSYPPHKHDTEGPGETRLEEIYYYETSGAGGYAFQQVTASDDRPIDLLVRVRSGDVVLVPYGWHGPSVADPRHDLYYLNVMAGPGERAWRVTTQPGSS
jgi:5-deoxy-glucuronate isomerase